MKQTAIRRPDPLTRTARWFYVGPRLLVLAALAVVGLLAGFLVVARFALEWLGRWGA